MNVVEIKKEDIPDAARVLADSFRHDPIFNYIFLCIFDIISYNKIMLNFVQYFQQKESGMKNGHYY